MNTSMKLLVISLSLFVLVGCFQGLPKEKTPIHLNPNMDTQEKYKAYRESNFFVDGSAMRQPVEGTVARGELREDKAFYQGVDTEGNELMHAPVAFTEDVLLRGQERYEIFCTPCHGQVGDGQGIIMQYKYPIPPTSFTDERILSSSDGYLYQVVSNGIRNMPSYKEQIPVADRWAIVGYVRALQISQTATAEDVPDDIQANL